MLKARGFTIVPALAILGATWWPASKLGSEFMPTLNEGTLFYLPIKARIDMLSTGLRAPVVVKVFGPDLKVTKGLGREIERVLRAIPAIYALVESGRMQLGRTGKSGSPRTHAISQ